MSKIKIVADSSADMLKLDGVDFASTPLKVIAGDREFVDDANLNVEEMVTFLETYKGKVQSSCPNVNDWMEAFGDAKEVICVTISSQMSGSHNAALNAKSMYEEEHPERKVHVVDSASAGPGLRLIVDKIKEYIDGGLNFEQVCEKIDEYKKNNHLYFMLKSVKNFANNGRISPIIAKIVGLLGICFVGKASEKGELVPMDKLRGEKNCLNRIMEYISQSKLSKGIVYITHCFNEKGAQNLATMIKNAFKEVTVKIFECRGLCSFYAERGGILVSYENC